MNEPRVFRKIVRSHKGVVLYAVLRRTAQTYMVVRWSAIADNQIPVVAFTTDETAETTLYGSEVVAARHSWIPRQDAVFHARRAAAAEPA